MAFHCTRARLACWGVLLLLLPVGVACGDPPALQPAEIIGKAVTTVGSITSMHFVLDTNKLAKYPPGLFLIHADGDVVRPDKLHATAKALLAGSAIEIQVIGVGPDQFMTDPASNRWQAMPPTLNVLAAFDPNKGLGAILTGAKDPQNDGAETIDGVACYRLKTTLSPKDLGDLSSEVDTGAAPLPARLWIASDDFRLRQAELNGILLKGDPAGVVRTVQFSHFNESFDIQKPALGSAPTKP
ncbi:MAG TPA: LppX_LprAFG lipoprotein [Chloroflexia bacterium]|nr:LppX_LprAFG lipoprotein [Chloroflexia bacterium]